MIENKDNTIVVSGISHLKMSKCRACLKSGRNMIPFDEKNIMYFNVLTNLNLKLSTYEQLCKRCFGTLQQFIKFREKCIAANAELSYIIPKESIKLEDALNNALGEIEVKEEVKIEDNDILFEDEMTDYDEIHNEVNYDKNLTYELVMKTEGKVGKNRKKKVIKIEKTEEKNITNHNKNSEARMPCGLCTESFEDILQLNSHLLTHRQYNSCPICGERFADWQELISHRVNHLPKNRQHPCHLCRQKFKTALYMEHHFRKNHHSEGEKQTLRCKLCNRNYSSPKRLYCHSIETHNSKNKAFYCDHCNKFCANKNMLKSHMFIHMDTKPFSCDQCDFTCKFKNNLRIHKVFKHNPNRVYCANCKNVFDSQAKSDQHVCKQSASVCPVCGKIFKCISMVNRHLLTHDKDFRYKCDRCPATFKGKSSLTVHKNKHDGIRKHACEFCPAKFYFASVLTKHRRTHTGIKPYVCKVCQKGFTGNNNLKVHMKVHGKFLINKKEPSDKAKNKETESCIKVLVNPQDTN